MLMSAIGCAGGSIEREDGRRCPHPTSLNVYNEKHRESQREVGGGGGAWPDSGCTGKESVWGGERWGGTVGGVC